MKPKKISDQDLKKINEMCAVLTNKIKVKKDAQYKDKYKEECLRIVWKCHFDEIQPPIELIVLLCTLMGEKHLWSVKKFYIIDFISLKYPPCEIGKDFPSGLLVEANRALQKLEGIQRSPRKLQYQDEPKDHNYRKTIAGWLRDPMVKPLG